MSKVTSSNLCKQIHDIINYSTSFVLLNLGSVERKGKITKKMNISRMKRAFSIKQKIFFIILEGLSFGEKNINLIKNGGHKLKGFNKQKLHNIKFVFQAILFICPTPQ